MKFSLILSTRGRTAEVVRVFEGFRAQTFQDFEIIVSDQNDDNRVVDLLAKIAWPGKITHIWSKWGLSAARNKALEIAQGDIIGFPDDDCKYPPTLLADVAEFFDKQTEYGVLSGRSVADDGGDAVSRHAKQAGPIRRATIYKQCIEFALFVRRSAIGEVRFDENMGVGARTPWGADEGPDFMLNLAAKGVKGYYDPAFDVWHPQIELLFTKALLTRSYKYSCGSGYFLRKHHYPFWFFLKVNARTFVGMLISLARFQWPRALYYWARIRGRIRGWNGYKAAQAKAGSGESSTT